MWGVGARVTVSLFLERTRMRSKLWLRLLSVFMAV